MSNAQQSWELMPENSTSIYQSLGNGRVSEMTLDSINQQNGVNRHHINLALRSSMGAGCDTTLVAGWTYQPLSNLLLFDAFEVRGDSHLIGSPELNKPFTLPPVGQAEDHTFFYDSLLLQRDSISVTSVFDQTDSCIYYSILHLDSTPTDWWLVRSKSFGILEGPSVRAMTSIETMDALNHMYKLIGWQDGNVSLGYELPSFNDWFGFEVGDRFLYEVERQKGPISSAENCTGFIEVIVDSTDQNGRSFFKRTDHEPNYLLSQDRCGVYLNFDFQLMLLEPWSPGMAAYRPYNIFSPILSLDSNDEEHLQLSMLDGQCAGLSIDAPSYLFDLTAGIGMWSQRTGSWGDYETYTLIASETSKGNYGVWPELLGGEHIATQSKLLVYPNPAEDKTYLKGDGLNDSNIEWSIQTINGSTLKNGHSTSIDVSELSKGLYILHLEGPQRDQWERIVVQ